MLRPTAEVFAAFLRLGLSSFGGPIAHLGYFRREFVERRRWLDDAQFAQLLAVSQFLPGPASSQLGFGIGLLRAGWHGALAAFVAFTLPSALLLYAVAVLGGSATSPAALAVVRALKLVAAVVVLDGVLRMARSLTPDAPRLAIAVAAAAVVVLSGSAWAQIVVIAAAALVGALGLHRAAAIVDGGLPTIAPRWVSAALLLVFAAGLGIALAWPTAEASLTALAAAMWRAGSLVFGGGHVVLPLLEESTVASGWLSREAFLTGYGAAQLIPGPMFSFAAYLGALTPTGAAPWIGASLAVLAVFAPGFVLLAAVLPQWSALAARPVAARAVAGVNAAVVGLLAAALIDPVLPAAVASHWDWAVIALGLGIQVKLKRPTFVVLALCLAAAWLLR